MSTNKPDSENFKGRFCFDNVFEWFMCSNNPYYNFKFNDGSAILIRDQIVIMDLTKTIRKVKI